VAVSGLTGSGISDLLKLIQMELYEKYTPIKVHLPYQQGALISIFHEMGQIERIEHGRGGVDIQGRIPGRLLARFTPWLNKSPSNSITRLSLDSEIEEEQV
jgi:GTP-binding protein HflX